MNKDKDLNLNISREWDANAMARHMQIKTGIDISYTRVLIPAVVKAIGNCQGKRCIDVGCGSGYLTSILAEKASFVVGVDLSVKMIRIAKEENRHLPNVEFFQSSIEAFSSGYSGPRFDVVVAHMSLMTAPYLGKVIDAIHTLLTSNGTFVFSITHPWFWNQYRKLEREEDFSYWKAHAQKAKFVISLEENGLPKHTTHYHRPLEYYMKQLYKSGFVIESMAEPLPSHEVHRLYPHKWHVPRFLIVRCRMA